MRILLGLLILTLTSCATTETTAPLAQSKPIPTEKRQQTLSSIQNWNLQGAIGIRTPQDNVSASLNWQQRNTAYTIAMDAPLGAGSFILTGQPGHVNLAMSNGQRFTANSPETLLAEQLHWRLPVSNMYYWVRGLPVPSIASQKRLDEYGHIVELDQAGWQIHYLGFTTINGIDVPSKLTLNTSSSISVRVVINKWVLS